MSEQQRRGTTGPGSAGADEIFLSPRVIDRQAFNDFAAQLRALIDDATAKVDALRGATSEAQRTRDNLREVVNANQMKLDMATRTLATIDQKAEQTRRMIESASDVAARVDELRQKADTIITERVGILCQRVNDAEQGAFAQVEQVHAELAAASKRADERVSALRGVAERASGPLVEELRELVDCAQSLTGGDAGLPSLVRRAEAAGELARQAQQALAQVREEAEQVRRSLADSVATAGPLVDEVGTVQGHLEATVNEAVRICQTAQKGMNEQVGAHRRTVDEQFARLAPLGDEIAGAADAARRAAGDADDASARLATLLSQLEPWRRVILSDEGEPIGAAISGVVTELKQEIRGVAGALRSIAERAELALEPSDESPRAVVRRATRETAA